MESPIAEKVEVLLTDDQVSPPPFQHRAGFGRYLIGQPDRPCLANVLESVCGGALPKLVIVKWLIDLFQVLVEQVGIG